jgi:hypothetical protein
MTDRDPYDDISHLDFDTPNVVPPPSDPRDWAPTEDVSDDTWVLDESDRTLQDRLAWKRYRQLRRARWVGAILALGIAAVSISAFLNHVFSDSKDATDVVQPDIDNAPTSAQMASYLPDQAAIEAVAPVFELQPGNTGGSYVNLSFEELDAGGEFSHTYGADAGVQQLWGATDGRELTVSIYLYADRDAAEIAEDNALHAAIEAGGQETVAHRFRSIATPGATPYRIATRVLSRFLVTFELAGPVDDAVADELLAVVADASAAVH